MRNIAQRAGGSSDGLSGNSTMSYHCVFFGDNSIINATKQLEVRGWLSEGKKLFMGDHYRTAAGIAVKWALSDTRHCHVEVVECSPSPEAKQRLRRMLEQGNPSFCS